MNSMLRSMHKVNLRVKRNDRIIVTTAMLITVRPWKALLAASIKAFSVSESKELVASSSMRHTEPLSTERANENLIQNGKQNKKNLLVKINCLKTYNCRCPALRFDPLSTISVSKPDGRALITSFN